MFEEQTEHLAKRRTVSVHFVTSQRAELVFNAVDESAAGKRSEQRAVIILVALTDDTCSLLHSPGTSVWS